LLPESNQPSCLKDEHRAALGEMVENATELKVNRPCSLSDPEVGANVLALG
jgi:hypothetical protein